MEHKITRETQLFKLPFLSSHNTMLTTSQLDGTIGLDALKLFLDQLTNTPVCIELDISKDSTHKEDICDNIYIDHHAKHFMQYDTMPPSHPLITESFDNFKKNYNICKVFSEINKYLEELKKDSKNRLYT